MSEVATGTPTAPGAAATPPTVEGESTVLAQASEVLDKVGDKASDLAEKLGDRAGEFADKFGDKAGEYVDKFGDRASVLADKAGDKAGEYADKVGDAVVRASTATGKLAAHVVERLRNNAELTSDRGATTIANEVVEKVAAIATREVPGVYDLGGDAARLFSALREKVGLADSSESADQGVKVRLEGKTAAVHITFVIEYGHVVYTVAELVRANVIHNVETMLGLEVTEVNLLVDDVHIADKPQD